jgi:opacity protein-like surface antigen
VEANGLKRNIAMNQSHKVIASIVICLFAAYPIVTHSADEGMYIGINGGMVGSSASFERSSSRLGDVQNDLGSASAGWGVEFGWRWGVGDWIITAAAGGGDANQRARYIHENDPTRPETLQQEITTELGRNARIGVRVGYMIGNGEVYGIADYMEADTTVRIREPFLDALVTYERDETLSAVRLGIGTIVPVTDRVAISFEMTRADFGSRRDDEGFAANDSMRTSFLLHEAMLGLRYRF